MAFQLDTSGHVRRPGFAKPLRWSDLDAFEQGYVEALFAEHGMDLWRARDPSPPSRRMFGFSDLSSEALALILRDCAEFQNIALGLSAKTGAVEGRRFWTGRQARFPGISNPVWSTAFPPQTVSLSDEGKVVLS